MGIVSAAHAQLFRFFFRQTGDISKNKAWPQKQSKLHAFRVSAACAPTRVFDHPTIQNKVCVGGIRAVSVADSRPGGHHVHRVEGAVNGKRTWLRPGMQAKKEV